MERHDLSRSSIHNHLRTLEQFGYVRSEADEYHIGIGTLMLGGFARDHHRLYQAARSAVNQLADETGELALLTTTSRGQSIYLYEVRGSEAVTYDSHIGVRFPMHCTATGKVMLAGKDEEYVDSVVERHGLPRYTENTISDREELNRELDEIRERGVAFDDEERIQGMRGIAVEIRNRETDELVGAISVAGPTSRIYGETFETDIPDRLRRNAQMVEVDLTYS